MNVTPLTRHFWQLAKRHHLPNALGRAIHMTSRRLNEGVFGATDAEYLFRMRRIKPETAERWLLHWANGGSVRCLGITHAMDLEKQRKRKAKVRATVRKWRNS